MVRRLATHEFHLRLIPKDSILALDFWILRGTGRRYTILLKGELGARIKTGVGGTWRMNVKSSIRSLAKPGSGIPPPTEVFSS
jgi:hypothetical protein